MAQRNICTQHEGMCAKKGVLKCMHLHVLDINAQGDYALGLGSQVSRWWRGVLWLGVR